jgi:hypothetical protein
MVVGEHAATPEDLPELALREIRQLDLEKAPDADTPAWIASASGVARRGDFVYVIGDELLEIGVFGLATGRPGRLRKVFEGSLPSDEGARKDVKPDLEALTTLPPVADEPQGGLIGLGSGSGEGRDRAFYWSFAVDGSLRGEPRTIRLTPVYDALREELGGQINIEGAAVFDDSICLFHRGNQGEVPNAVAEFGLGDLSRTLAEDLVVDPGELRAVRTYELGEIEGTPVCFSDATTLTGGLVCFTGSAEDEESGAIEGSVVGTIDAEGRVRRLRTIDRRWKVEGVDATVDTGVVSFLFVCDQDDPGAPSPLLSATMPVDSHFDC